MKNTYFAQSNNRAEQSTSREWEEIVKKQNLWDRRACEPIQRQITTFMRNQSAVVRRLMEFFSVLMLAQFFRLPLLPHDDRKILKKWIKKRIQTSSSFSFAFFTSFDDLSSFILFERMSGNDRLFFCSYSKQLFADWQSTRNVFEIEFRLLATFWCCGSLCIIMASLDRPT